MKTNPIIILEVILIFEGKVLLERDDLKVIEISKVKFLSFLFLGILITLYPTYMMMAHGGTTGRGLEFFYFLIVGGGLFALYYKKTRSYETDSGQVVEYRMPHDMMKYIAYPLMAIGAVAVLFIGFFVFAAALVMFGFLFGWIFYVFGLDR